MTSISSYTEKSLGTATSGAMAVIGSEAVIEGIHDISNGGLGKGAKKALFGLTALNLGSRCLDMGHKVHMHLMKWALVVGTMTAASNGIPSVVQGIRNRNISSIAEGVMRIASGGAVAVYLHNVDPKIFAVAHQALVMLLASGYAAFLGVKQLKNGHFRSGAFGILAGASGMAIASYYSLSEINQEIMLDRNIPQDLDFFLKTQEQEIEQMYESKVSTGDWDRLGNGVSKVAFVHRDLDDYIIKIPLSEESFWGHKHNDAVSHVINVNRAREIVQNRNYQFIEIPNSYLLETIQGHKFIAETKFKPIKNYEIPSGPLKSAAEAEHIDALKQLDLCDVMLSWDHNAAWISGAEGDKKIAYFDFDCDAASLALQITAPSLAIITTAAKTSKIPLTTAVIGMTAAIGGIVYFASNADPLRYERFSPVFSLALAGAVGSVSSVATACLSYVPQIARTTGNFIVTPSNGAMNQLSKNFIILFSALTLLYLTSYFTEVLLNFSPREKVSGFSDFSQFRRFPSSLSSLTWPEIGSVP